MKVLVGLSGGVDSAVAAYLLQQEGHEVVVGFMLNYLNEDDPNCTTKKDLESFHAVRKHLGIEAYEIFDYREEYEQRILNYIYEGYQQGITPNPDVYCNSLVKFDLFLKEAIQMGFDAIATGHYAQIVRRSLDNQKIPEDLPQTKEIIDKKTYDIIGMCMKIHNEFGNILTEKQYENILVDSLRKQGLSVKQQVPMDVIFEGKKYGTRFIDIVVDDCVVLELKTLHTEYELKKGYKQTRSYLTLGNYYSGLLIDFGGEKLRYHRLNNPEYMSSSISSQLSSDISYHLLKGVDASKDQSYFLSQLNQEQLSKAIFPLGGMNKSEVRLLAHQIGLPNADRPDSQGLCFVGKVKMGDFLAEKLGSKPGDIVDLQGTVVGHHEGAYRYTIGQRRGLYLPFQAYVSDVNVLDNVVTVARVGEEDILLTDRIIIHNPHWISGEAPQLGDYQCKIRYRQEGQGCKLKRLNDFVGGRGGMTSSAEQRQIPAKGKDAEYVIEFDESIKGVANGQIVVIYDGDEVVGSGVIKKIVGD